MSFIRKKGGDLYERRRRRSRSRNIRNSSGSTHSFNYFCCSLNEPTIKANAIIIIVVVALYTINNLLIKKNTFGLVGEFFNNYFNDLCCTPLFLAYVNLLLRFIGQEIQSLVIIEAVCLSAGLFWEIIAPIFITYSVTDICDLICYMVGGIVYYQFIKQRRIK